MQIAEAKLTASSGYQNTKSYRQCIETLFNLTQRCHNPYHAYTTTLSPPNSTFGHEFNHYLLRSLWHAFLANRRLKYLISKRDWDFDCHQKLGWACYLHFSPQCDMSMVEPKNMSLIYVRHSSRPLQQPGPHVADRNRIDAMYFHQTGTTTGLETMATHFANVLPPGICSFAEGDI